MIPALILGCLLLAGLLLVFSGILVSGSNQSTQQAFDAQTELALMVQATQQAGTATALFLSNANQATINAVTETARWMVGDDDFDGLNNFGEFIAGHLPTNAASVHAITTAAINGTQNFSVRFPTATETAFRSPTYKIQYADNLAAPVVWTTVPLPALSFPEAGVAQWIGDSP